VSCRILPLPLVEYIKSFLNTGIYIPPSHLTAGTSSSILHISRLLFILDPQRSFRFILVDTSDQFKPDYWSRVVAVFTTGQTWQFKNCKWSDQQELFRNVLG
jgi:parafibromin